MKFGNEIYGVYFYIWGISSIDGGTNNFTIYNPSKNQYGNNPADVMNRGWISTMNENQKI